MRISDWSSDVCSSDLDSQKPAGNGGRRDPEPPGRCHRTPGHPCRIRQIKRKVHCKRRRLAAGNGRRTAGPLTRQRHHRRSEEHTSELQSLMRISYAVFCVTKKKAKQKKKSSYTTTSTYAAQITINNQTTRTKIHNN